MKNHPFSVTSMGIAPGGNAKTRNAMQIADVVKRLRVTARTVCLFAWRGLMPVSLLLASVQGQAQTVLPANATPLQTQVYQTVLAYVTQQTVGYPGVVKIDIQPLDARVRLTACDQMEGYTLQGTKLWGKTHVGVRCVATNAKPWQIYVQTDVQVWGEYAVTALPVSQGTLLQPHMVVMQYGDLSKQPSGVITEPIQLNGKQAALNLPLGSVLRPEVLKAMPVILQGQTVQIVSQGEGFVITAEGIANHAANAGQMVDVKVRSGQVIKGLATANGRIEMRF